MRERSFKDIFLFAYLIGALVIMAFYVVVYKLENPSLEIKSNTSSSVIREEQAREMRKKIAEFMMRIKENPKDIDALEGLGSIFMQMGAWDKASFFFERALRFKGEDTDIQWDLATCYFYLKDYKDAAAMMERVVQERKKDYPARFNLALIYGFYLHKKKEAMAILHSLIRERDVPLDIKKQAREKLKQLEHK